MKTVKVTANPKTGKVFTQTMEEDGVTPKKDKNGNEHGSIRIEQRIANLDFAYNKAVRVRSTLIPMTVAAFNEAQDLYTNGSVHAGQIVREDSLEPFYEGQKPLKAPCKDKNGIVITDKFVTITSGGKPVYRNEYFTKNQNAVDVKLASYDDISAEVNESVATKATVLSA
jgi:hypothetical protein